MGGNQRHGAKGSDRQKSTCEDCGMSFKHGKFSRYTFCDSCREKRQEEAELKTEINVFKKDGNLYISVTIINSNEVPLYIPTENLTESEHSVSTIGYVSVTSDDFYAENVILYSKRMTKIKVKRDSTYSFEFRLENNELIQENKPTVKYTGVVGEDVRELNKNQRGVWDSSELEIHFSPCEKSSDAIGSAETTFDPVKEIYTV